MISTIYEMIHEWMYLRVIFSSFLKNIITKTNVVNMFGFLWPLQETHASLFIFRVFLDDV